MRIERKLFADFSDADAKRNGRTLPSSERVRRSSDAGWIVAIEVHLYVAVKTQDRCDHHQEGPKKKLLVKI